MRAEQKWKYEKGVSGKCAQGKTVNIDWRSTLHEWKNQGE
jgi:hypothetical protein